MPNLTTIPWTLPGSDGQTIFGDAHRSQGDPVGILLICHGFKGYKDYGFFPQLAAAAASHGWVAYRFNFSHSGMTNKTDTFERATLFEADTWSKQIFDLQEVAAAVRRGEVAGDVAGSAQFAELPMAWFGHSRGGVTALLAAGRAFADATGSLVKPGKVIAAASPDVSCSLPPNDRKTLHLTGRMPVLSSRTGQMLYVGLTWLTEMEADPDAFDPKLAAGRIGCPMLFIHGDADETVAPTASRHLADAAGKRGRLVMIAGASHTFNAPNPLPMDQAPPPETAAMIEDVVGFLA